MRSGVSRRGVAGSTFDHVAREAGVSRGAAATSRVEGAAARRGRQARLEVRPGGDVRRAGPSGQRRGPGDALGPLALRHRPPRAGVHLALLLELYATPADARRSPTSRRRYLTQAMADAFAQRLQTLVDDGRITIGAAPRSSPTSSIGFGHGLALRFMSNPEADMEPVVEAAKRGSGHWCATGPRPGRRPGLVRPDRAGLVGAAGLVGRSWLVRLGGRWWLVAGLAVARRAWAYWGGYRLPVLLVDAGVTRRRPTTRSPPGSASTGEWRVP